MLFPDTRAFKIMLIWDYYEIVKLVYVAKPNTEAEELSIFVIIGGLELSVPFALTYVLMFKDRAKLSIFDY